MRNINTVYANQKLSVSSASIVDIIECFKCRGQDNVQSHDRPIREPKQHIEEDCLTEPEYNIYNKHLKIKIYKVF